KTELDQPQALKWQGTARSTPETAWRYPTLSAVGDAKPHTDKKDEASRAEADATLRKAVDDLWRKAAVKPAKPEDVAAARQVVKGLAGDSPVTVVRAVWTKLLDEPAPPEVALK